MPWLLLSITGPILWSLSNTLDTGIRRYHIKEDLTMAWSIIMFRLPIVLVFLVLFPPTGVSGSIILKTLFIGVIFASPQIFYAKVLHFEEPTKINILLQFIPIFSLLLAIIILSEQLTSWQALSFLLIFSAGILGSLEKTESKWCLSKALLLIGIASFLWALSDVLFKTVQDSYPSYFHASAIFLSGYVLSALSILLIRSKRRKIISTLSVVNKRGWMLHIVAQTFGFTGDLAFFYALTLGKVALTTVMSGLMPIISTLFIWLTYKRIKEIDAEKNGPLQLTMKIIATILIVGGLYLLT